MNILNSMSEWFNSTLPRLVTTFGKLEDEVKTYEKEMKED